jgi:hypothetical protein
VSVNKLRFIAMALMAAGAAAAGPRDDASTAPAAAAPAAEEVQINFANRGGIWNWDVVDSRTLLIQDRARKWYKATLLVNCVDLPFEHRVGFLSNPDGSFDRLSAVQTRQQRCPLTSLVRTDAPAPKKKPKKSAADTPPPPPPAPAADVRSLNQPSP